LIVLAVIVTMPAVAIAAAAIYLIWWAFTTHERRPG
jgi:hypothetical protein